MLAARLRTAVASASQQAPRIPTPSQVDQVIRNREEIDGLLAELESLVPRAIQRELRLALNGRLPLLEVSHEFREWITERGVGASFVVSLR